MHRPLHFLALALLLPTLFAFGAEPSPAPTQEQANLEAAGLSSLIELKPLGWLKSQNSSILPHQLLSAKPCAGPSCKEDRRLYLVRADGKKSAYFVYPGKVVDNKGTKKSRPLGVILTSRAFFGKCLSPHDATRFSDPMTDHYVVFQQERVDRRAHLQASVFVATPGELLIKDHLIERGLPKIQHTLAQVKRKQCFEINGENRLMGQLVVNIHPNKPESPENKDDEDDNKEDEPTKENNTDKDLTPASVVSEPSNGA